MSTAGAFAMDGGDPGNPSLPEQGEQLLVTKLFLPPLRPNRVNRPRLFERLNGGLDKTLILVSAPAGYGKTTLVSGWLHETQISSTWLSLDEDDNDPIRFLHYFITALQKIIPSIRLDLLGVLQDRQPATYKLLMNIVINEIAGCAFSFVLVLDEFQAIHAQPVLEILTHLLEHLPPQAHVVLLSRTDPPLPLARLRARNQLVDLRAGQLRFTREEITLFLNEAMGLRLSGQDIEALEARTEGWIAGLQLASIALQGAANLPPISTHDRDEVHGFVSAFTGSHAYIMDYLAEEALRLQDETIRSFLLQSSILERMCGPLCDALTGDGQPATGNGQALLETLEQMNLFIIPLDGERRWYRYHHLFADVLNRRLEQSFPDRLPDLHRRASGWYEQNGLIYDAIHHALAAGDQDRAAQLVDQNGCLLLMRGEVVNLMRWIEAVEPHAQALPWIAIQKGWALCLTGQAERAGEPLDTAEQLIAPLERTDDVRIMAGTISAARAFRANLQGETRLAAELARQALDCLPASSDFSCSLRSVATSILGDACWLEGDLSEAQRAYADAVLISQASGNPHIITIARTNLAEVLVEQGQLHRAARIYSEALETAALPDGQVSPLAEGVYAGLSKVSYAWNHLEDAEKQAQQVIELSRQWGSVETQAIGLVMLAAVEQAQGSREKAQEALRLAEGLTSGFPVTHWQSISLLPALARAWILTGNLEKASFLIQKGGILAEVVPEDGEISTLQAPWYLALLRLRLAQGDEGAVLALSQRLLPILERTNRAGRVIETLVLQALAYQGRREPDLALATLGKALSLARPEGFRRVFLDEGEPMAKLLFQAGSQRDRDGYAAELLSAMGAAFGSALPPAQLLIEPLTVRELEVLKLIEAGYSNQEIAAELFISMPTVKRHISNIYTKLGANSRTQAILRGKELNLFQ